MDKWTQIQFFVHVAEQGSLSLAAEKMDMSNAAASRTLSALEDRLGVRLVERTTRRLWLTEAGMAFHVKCAAILCEMANAEAEVQENTTQPGGLLKVTSSVSFAVIHIAPIFREFSRRYPQISLEVVTANRYPDFIEAGIDVAIRTREFESDSGITVRRLATTRRILAATPSYLEDYGKPSSPSDLQNHSILIYSLAKDPHVLHLTKGTEKVDINLRSTLESNEGQVIVAAGLSGAGILIQPMYIIYNEIMSGRLVPVLPDWHLPDLVINLAYQSRRHQPAKIKVFTEFLVERFETLDIQRT